jgi:hypothetical protein
VSGNRKTTLFKTFLIGTFLGIVAGAAALYFVQPVDQARERSIINVTPNGGNNEIFHANIPDDRIVIGAANQATPVPRGLEWPQDELLANTRAELFKIRNANDIVVGVASRIAGSGEQGSIVEWAIHMPARGSGYILMRPKLESEPFRKGDLRFGTREFAGLVGQVTERWVADASGSDLAPAGRIELSTQLVAVLEDEL